MRACGQTRSFVRLVGLFLLCLGLASPSLAGPLYRYIDETGVVHFTDTPVDDRYRPFEIPWGEKRKQVQVPINNSYDTLIMDIGVRHGVTPALVKAVIAAESNFDPQAVSPKGAQGLMQLMPSTARQMGVTSPFEAKDNITGGTRYLRKMIDRFGSLENALAAYNAGPHVVLRYRGIPPYPETQRYVERVLSYYRRYDDDVFR